jgi:glucokinase
MILAGDIGGTKTNLAYFDAGDNSLALHTNKSYPSQTYRSLDDIVRVFVEEFPADIRHAAFGVAGPVIDGRCETTNISWVVDSRDIARQLGLRNVGLINDLEATAYGTLRLGKKDLHVLNPGTLRRGGAIAVIAAGTGLGEGGLVWDGVRYRALPSEGGHSDFAPRNELEMELLRFLVGRFGQVSWERLVSGPGLYNIYQFLRSRAGSPEPSWLSEQISNGDPSAAVSQAALQEKDSVCVQAVEMFVSLYGAEAGNLALKFLATGGVYVGGGIAPKLLDKIRRGTFLQSFVQKDSYSKLMQSMPLYVVLNEKTALYGAAHYAISEPESG